MHYRALTAAAFLLWLSACGNPGDDNNVLAKVGTVDITVEDLQRFNAKIPALQRSEEEGVKLWRDYLESMVDMELLLLEAREQGIDQEPEFVSNWEDERRKKLLEEILRREVQDKIDLPTEKLRRRFRESNWNRMLKLARIQVATENDAGKVMKELEGGRDFGDVAEEYSTDVETASLGGEVSSLYGRGTIEELGMPVEVAEEVFKLEVGKTSQPFETENGYEIYQVLTEGPAPATYMLIYSQVEVMKASRARRNELMEELATQFSVRLNEDAIALLIEKAPSPGATIDLEPSEQEMVLCSFDGGRFTLKDFADTHETVSRFRPARFDNSGLTEFVYKELLATTLLSKLALKDGVVQDSSVVAWLDAKKKAMLIKALKERAVDQKIDLGDETVRSYYENHLSLFTKPEQITVHEILCATREKAEDMVDQIRNGEDLRLLAKRHSIREDAKRVAGLIHIHRYSKDRYGDLYDEAVQAEVGELKGPVQLNEGYTVFRVTERMGFEPDSFDDARPRAQYWVRSEKEKKLIEDLLSNLKKKYASKIVLFEERLKRMNEEASI